jgi:hypothetical protein
MPNWQASLLGDANQLAPLDRRDGRYLAAPPLEAHRRFHLAAQLESQPGVSRLRDHHEREAQLPIERYAQLSGAIARQRGRRDHDRSSEFFVGEGSVTKKFLDEVKRA